MGSYREFVMNRAVISTGQWLMVAGFSALLGAAGCSTTGTANSTAAPATTPPPTAAPADSSVSSGRAVANAAPASGQASTPSDSALAQAVQNALAQDAMLGSAPIRVSVANGQVTLVGEVANARAYIRAQSVARQVDGVRPPVNVVNLTYPRP